MAVRTLTLAALLLAIAAPGAFALADAPQPPPLVDVGGDCDAVVLHVGCQHWSAPPPGTCAVYWGLTDRCIIF